MAFDQIDPGALEGDALRRWYMRSPAEIEQERQRAAARRYEDFFGDSSRADSGPLDGQGGAGDSGVAAFSGGVNNLPFDRSMLALASTSADQRPQSASVLSSYQPTSRPASPLIHVAAQPSQPISARVRQRLGSPPAAYASTGGQSQIAYGALRAPAPSDQELADLRRQQAAFGNTARQIDIHNSWFAAPALAPALVAMGLGAAGEWATGEVVPEVEEAVANFVERDPYPRVGDNWATRAGRRAHAALKERLAQKPGWEYEPKLPREGQRPLKPDMGTPKRNPIDPDRRKYIELKPDSPSGRAAGARALERYRDATQDPVRLLFYKLKDFI